MNLHQINRRELLRSGAFGAGAFYLAPGLLSLDVWTGSARSSGDGNVLVVVQLSGGNDGLSTVVPFGNDDYHRNRNALRIRKNQCIPLNDELGFNGQLEALGALYKEGQLAVVQGVGYPTPNRSHFKSMDIWQSADPSDRVKTSGWLGRMAEICCSDQADPDFTINVSQEAPLALMAPGTRPVSFVNPAGYSFRASWMRPSVLI